MSGRLALLRRLRGAAAPRLGLSTRIMNQRAYTPGGGNDPPAVLGVTYTHARAYVSSSPSSRAAEPAAVEKPWLTRIDEYGATSVVEESELGLTATKFENVDGKRIEDGRYAAFAEEISDFIPKHRQFTDPIRTFAYGTDASFYRLNPKMVVKIHTEDEIRRLLPIARKHGVPVTFRAAGTSLSGQAITDSVLLKISHTGRNFRGFQVHGDGSAITVQSGLIGGEVNRILARHKVKNGLPIQYKIGPDPASIESCMVGGIVSNNASGMCCGVSQNTYNTLRDLRIVLLDGTVLDTADPSSCAAFLESHAGLVEGVQSLARRVQSDPRLSALIRRKFAIKCTTGYSLNALVDFPVDEPIEMIKRLMVGSEGTLAFVTNATYNTVPEWPHKASAWIMFPTIDAACSAAAVLRRETAVDAVELFDRPSLYQFETNDRMRELCPDIHGADADAASLLIECRGQTQEKLAARIREVEHALAASGLEMGSRAGEPRAQREAYPFRHDARDYSVYWDVRKGLIPIVGGAREPGTTMLLEDVVCPIESLAPMTRDLIEMFRRWGYDDAYTFGHALEGNLHLVFSQGFRTPEEVSRFSHVMDEMCDIVANRYGGSLKGEHGTGRNMAPHVEMEWGRAATALMWELKELFDPDYVLNPGVVLNRDHDVHLKHLKASPVAHDLVNHCIECGFCESNCPSRDLTITPRQRIVTFRELSRLDGLVERGEATPAQRARRDAMAQLFEYNDKDTCAADGMCKEKCPVSINTGALIKELRRVDMEERSPRLDRLAAAVAERFGAVAATMRVTLAAVDAAHRVLGPRLLETTSNALNRVSGRLVPTWTPWMPGAASALDKTPALPDGVPGTNARGEPLKVVYAPTCVNRIMGPARGDPERTSQHEKMVSVMRKAGYEVIIPDGIGDTCCGMMFNTRGFARVATSKAHELERLLIEASEGGKHPIVVDTSPCLAQLKGSLSTDKLKFSLYDPVEFILRFLGDRLEWRKVRGDVAVHVPCSSKQMGLSAKFAELAGKCADNVVDSNIPCCGMAGDRGMRFPELPRASLQHLGVEGCADGYSASRTCELGLSNQSGIPFRAIVYLVDEATTPKQTPTTAKAAEA